MLRVDVSWEEGLREGGKRGEMVPEGTVLARFSRSGARTSFSFLLLCLFTVLIIYI